MDFKTILIIAVCVLAGLGICLLLGYLEIEPFTVPYAYVIGWMGSFNAQEVISNPATILTTVGAAAAVAIPLLSKLNSAKQQVQTTVTAAKTEIGGLTKEVGDITGKLESTELNLSNANTKISEANTKITELSQSSSDWQTKADTYKQQLDRLQGNYTELQKIRASDVIASLPGGTVIQNPDGSKTAVVEKTIHR
jgi:hypothetical protein